MELSWKGVNTSTTEEVTESRMSPTAEEAEPWWLRAVEGSEGEQALCSV